MTFLFMAYKSDLDLIAFHIVFRHCLNLSDKHLKIWFSVTVSSVWLLVRLCYDTWVSAGEAVSWHMSECWWGCTMTHEWLLVRLYHDTWVSADEAESSLMRESQRGYTITQCQCLWVVSYGSTCPCWKLSIRWMHGRIQERALRSAWRKERKRT